MAGGNSTKANAPGTDSSVRFEVGGDLAEFRRYYGTSGWASELGSTEDAIIRQNPRHLILVREGEEILGHAIWHESNPRNHPSGEPRDPEDRRALERLLDDQSFVELHELWLRKEYRSRGIGKRLFEFLEGFLRDEGHSLLVFYAFHPAAVAICRSRGYSEARTEVGGRPMWVFCGPLMAAGP